MRVAGRNSRAGRWSSDQADARVRTACEYVLAHTQASSGGFLASGCNDGASPPPPRVIHCRTGNLLRALLGFGWYNEYAYNGKTWVDFDPQG